jgi:hypothetical protein
VNRPRDRAGDHDLARRRHTLPPKTLLFDVLCGQSLPVSTALRVPFSR